ncbi:cytochrome c oxidase assembly protein [Streptomyces mesophilus]|uniref:cytochrome c oxidase assembly protein n=1 Tax=Streptomyces mesophilus TaxID=1775132 RepID=UPI003317C6C4
MTAALGLMVVVCCLAYARAAARLRARGDEWSPVRTASFCAGGAVIVAALAAPWHEGPPFTGHMAAHLALGMIAPVLLAPGRPVTLALRALPVGARRGLLVCVRSRAAALLMWPPFAALVHTASLWALYRTPVLAAVHHRPWAHLLVSVHLLLSGLLFTFAVLAFEPVRHRTGHVLRAGVLLAASAAHGVLAKSLYATGPPGTAYRPEDLQAGSHLMYYGGDLTGIALALLLAHQWYASGGRALNRERRHGPDGVRPAVGARQE